MHRRAGSAPRPLPPAPLAEPGGGRGEQAGESCPAWGILSREGGICGKGIWWGMFAGGFGMFPRQDILAGLLGGSVWRVKLAHSFSGFSKQGKTYVVEQ